MFVIHYAEIGLKGKNRAMFEKQLVQNIQARVKGRVKRVPGRFLLETKDPKAKEKLARVFGIANFSQAVSCKPGLAEMNKAALGIMKGRKGTFKVAARREWKALPFTSMELNERVGAEVVKKLGLKVKMKKPYTTLHIEVLRDRALLYTEVLQGPGGLPIGVSGKVVCLLSGGIDSPVAGWMAMKRGCEVVFLHFWNQAMGGKGKMAQLMRELRKWQPRARLVVVPFRDIQNQIIAQVPADWRIIIYRRMMLRVAERLAGKVGAEALVTGSALGQVSSQTLSNMAAIEEAVDMPVFNPLIGFDKQEIVNLAKRVGTYSISIKPYQDCCTFMVAKHPVTRARLAGAKRLEAGLDMAKMLGKVKLK
ncbi:MAG: tRNA uracil 4-sulfurtransferase ThiI [Candidatus Aenigmatarchaeota archaeon]